MPQAVESIVCYEAWSGNGSGSYDICLVYDDWEEALADIKAALDHGRDVLITRTVITRDAFEEGGVVPKADVTKFRGEA